MITFRCHACARKIVVEDNVKNHVVECPKCKSKNVVPDPAHPTEFARKKEHAELKKIYEIREQGGMTEAEFEEVQAKVYELAWGAPPESVPKEQLQAASPEFGGAAAETEAQQKEEEDFQAWLQQTTGGIEDEPGGGSGHAQTFGGVNFECEHCSASITAPLSLIGQEFTCPECHKTNIVPMPKKEGEEEEALEVEDLEVVEDEAEEVMPGSMPEQTGSLPTLDAPAGGHYKVIPQDDLKIAGTLNASSIQQALNTYHQQGWKIVAASNVKFTGTTETQLIFILEK